MTNGRKPPGSRTIIKNYKKMYWTPSLTPKQIEDSDRAVKEYSASRRPMPKIDLSKRKKRK